MAGVAARRRYKSQAAALCAVKSTKGSCFERSLIHGKVASMGRDRSANKHSSRQTDHIRYGRLTVASRRVAKDVDGAGENRSATRLCCWCWAAAGRVARNGGAMDLRRRSWSSCWRRLQALAVGAFESVQCQSMPHFVRSTGSTVLRVPVCSAEDCGRGMLSASRVRAALKARNSKRHVAQGL